MTGTARPNDRAISTVVDVSFALLLVSASIAVLAVHLTDSDQSVDDREADEVAEMLSAATVSTEYSLGAITGDSPNAMNTRNAHGTAADLLGSAAVTNVALDGSRVTEEGKSFTRSLRGEIRELLTGAGTEARVVAVWEPYPDAEMRGLAEAGPTAPPGADVSTATLTVDSGIPAVADDRIENAYADAPAGDPFGPVSELLARAIVEGYFPPEETQLALEQQGFERTVVTNRYERMKAEVNDWYPSTTTVDYHYDYSATSSPTSVVTGPTYIDRNYADVEGANDVLVDGLAESIEADLEATYGTSPSVSPERFANDVSTGKVTITVRTWSE